MKNELNNEQLLNSNHPIDMELNLTQRIVTLRNSLAVTAMQLSAKGELNFAKHLRLSVAQLNTALEEIRWTNVLEFLGEIENILLACKLGVNPSFDEAVFQTVQLVRADVKGMVQQKQLTR